MNGWRAWNPRRRLLCRETELPFAIQPRQAMSPNAKPKFKNPRAKSNFQGRTCSIAGVGSYVPARILTNADLEKMVSTSDEWITTRTGIKERRHCRQR